MHHDPNQRISPTARGQTLTLTTATNGRPLTNQFRKKTTRPSQSLVFLVETNVSRPAPSDDRQGAASSGRNNKRYHIPRGWARRRSFYASLVCTGVSSMPATRSTVPAASAPAPPNCLRHPRPHPPPPSSSSHLLFAVHRRCCDRRSGRHSLSSPGQSGSEGPPHSCCTALPGSPPAYYP